MPEPEKKLWFGYLRDVPKKFPQIKFLRQKPIEYYIVDFYCAAAKLVVELDGDDHFSSKEVIVRDRKRDEVLFAKHRLRVLRFSNLEVMSNFEGVCGEIEKYLE